MVVSEWRALSQIFVHRCSIASRSVLLMISANVDDDVVGAVVVEVNEVEQRMIQIFPRHNCNHQYTQTSYYSYWMTI